MNIQLADLKREYDLRTVWPNEAYDFTPWLENNLKNIIESTSIIDEDVITNIDIVIASEEVQLFKNEYDYVAEAIEVK